MTRGFWRPFSSALRPGVTLLLALAFAGGAAATTFSVTNLADSGPGSLRQAVLDANAAAGADTVAFTVAGTITLTSGEIAISDDLTVDGPGAGTLTVSGNDQSRIFNVDNGASDAIDVTLSGLTLTQGHALSCGGAVAAAGENLTILDSVISNSVSRCCGNVAFLGAQPPAGVLRIEGSTLTGGHADANLERAGGEPAPGGNLCAYGTVILERSVLSNGVASEGGGLYGGWGATTIRSSSILGNRVAFLGAFPDGGGIFFLSGTLTIESSTIAGNSSGEGGGMTAFASMVDVLDSTFSGNTAEFSGGGILYESGAGISGSPGSSSMRLRLTTITNNHSIAEGGNLASLDAGSRIDVDHSIVANGTPDDVTGLVFPEHSLIEKKGHFGGPDNIFGVDPLLGPLADNGGPTLTHALLAGSAAIDAGDPAIPDPPALDQRGLARIFGPAIDLGAIEGQPSVIAVPTLSQWAILLLSALLCAAGLWRLHPRP